MGNRCSPRTPADALLDVYVLFDMAFLEALGTLLEYEGTISWRWGNVKLEFIAGSRLTLVLAQDITMPKY